VVVVVDFGGSGGDGVSCDIFNGLLGAHDAFCVNIGDCEFGEG